MLRGIVAEIKEIYEREEITKSEHYSEQLLLILEDLG